MNHPRGIYEPNFTGPGDHPMLLAVDSDGRLVAHVSVMAPEHRPDVIQAFRQLLGMIDPDAKLTLVR